MFLTDYKLYRWWKGGVWTCFIIKYVPFIYWTRQPTLYTDIKVIDKEIYEHQRDIRGERFE
jgi:hypothetical protein